MGEAHKLGEEYQVNIPIQMMAVTDTSGTMNPMRFRLETVDHEIKTVNTQNIVSRLEKNHVGIREKQYICIVEMGDTCSIVEIRYSVDTQKWRDYQFLS